MAALKFRVLLDTPNEQEIFRDILIDENANFETFYRGILSAFRFEGQEIGSFYVSNNEWDKGYEIALLDMRYSDEDMEASSVMSESLIKDFIETQDQKFILVYDFIRMWIFLIELLETVDIQQAVPSVALAVGMAPPEDSKLLQDDAFMGDEGDDEFQDEDFEDGYDEEDFSDFNEYEY